MSNDLPTKPLLTSSYKKPYKDNDISEVLKEMKLLREKINTLEQEVKNTNLTLINHINFISSVYEGIKRPLTYIMNKVNNVLLINDRDDVNLIPMPISQHNE
jgi:UDP-glucose 4-epimerase